MIPTFNIATFDSVSLQTLCSLPDGQIGLFMRTLSLSGLAPQSMIESLFGGDEVLIDLFRKVKVPDDEILLDMSGGEGYGDLQECSNDLLDGCKGC